MALIMFLCALIIAASCVSIWPVYCLPHLSIIITVPVLEQCQAVRDRGEIPQLLQDYKEGMSPGFNSRWVSAVRYDSLNE